MTKRFSTVLRWVLLVPASITAAFLVGSVIRQLAPGGAGTASSGLGYATALLSGLAYVWTALKVAHTVAPSHKSVVVTVLAVLILGDLSFVHLLLEPGVITLGGSAGEGELGMLLALLGADDYRGLQSAGLVRLAGAIIGCYVGWRRYVRKRATAPE